MAARPPIRRVALAIDAREAAFLRAVPAVIEDLRRRELDVRVLFLDSATDVLVAAAVKQLPAEQRQRFHPFLSGFNPNDKNADAHIRRMLELDPGLWQGIGEVFTRHDDLTSLTEGDTPRAPACSPLPSHPPGPLRAARQPDRPRTSP